MRLIVILFFLLHAQCGAKEPLTLTYADQAECPHEWSAAPGQAIVLPDGRRIEAVKNAKVSAICFMMKDKLRWLVTWETVSK